jgi:hypothetical protein
MLDQCSIRTTEVVDEGHAPNLRVANGQDKGCSHIDAKVLRCVQPGSDEPFVEDGFVAHE